MQVLSTWFVGQFLFQPEEHIPADLVMVATKYKKMKRTSDYEFIIIFWWEYD